MRLSVELVSGALIAFVSFYSGYFRCWSEMSNAPKKEEKTP